MRKKLISLILVVCCAFSAFALSACGDDYAELEFGVRYIANNSYIDSSDDDACTYVIFSKNNVGIYHYFVSNYSFTRDYKIKFKYTYVDEDKSAVVCFFDSITFGDMHTADTDVEPYNDWTTMFMVSKNVLVSTTSSEYLYFINKNYLKSELTNFRKEA